VQVGYMYAAKPTRLTQRSRFSKEAIDVRKFHILPNFLV